MRLITMIQARMGSSRLPGKVMLPLLDEPLLSRMIERVKMAQYVERIVVITSILPADDPIVNFCIDHKIECFRGHPTDLLDRHYHAALFYQADAIAKIPSDCPLIDPLAIDSVFRTFLENHGQCDYISNLHPPSWPDGNDVEIMTFNSLFAAWQEAAEVFEREHTTPFLWERPERFRIFNVLWETGLDHSDKLRLTIDYLSDYSFIKAIFEHLYPTNKSFSVLDILALLDQKPELMSINSHYNGRYWYENHLDKLHHIDDYKTKLNI